MVLSEDWEESFQRLYERTYTVLITAGCDEAQAQAIAKERIIDTAQRMLKQDGGPNVVILK